MEIYLHTPDSVEPKLVEVDESVTVTDLLDGVNGDLLFIEDEEAELDSGVTLAQVGVAHLSHVAAAYCKSVTVSVRYNAETKSKTFSPAARVRRVTHWATGPHGFDLPAAEIPRHLLAVPGSDKRVPEGTLLVSLTERGHCEVRFDLQPKVRHEG